MNIEEEIKGIMGEKRSKLGSDNYTVVEVIADADNLHQVSLAAIAVLTEKETAQCTLLNCKIFNDIIAFMRAAAVLQSLRKLFRRTGFPGSLSSPVRKFLGKDYNPNQNGPLERGADPARWNNRPEGEILGRILGAGNYRDKIKQYDLLNLTTLVSPGISKDQLKTVGIMGETLLNIAYEYDQYDRPIILEMIKTHNIINLAVSVKAGANICNNSIFEKFKKICRFQVNPGNWCRQEEVPLEMFLNRLTAAPGPGAKKRKRTPKSNHTATEPPKDKVGENQGPEPKKISLSQYKSRHLAEAVEEIEVIDIDEQTKGEEQGKINIEENIARVVEGAIKKALEPWINSAKEEMDTLKEAVQALEPWINRAKVEMDALKEAVQELKELASTLQMQMQNNAKSGFNEEVDTEGYDPGHPGTIPDYLPTTELPYHILDQPDGDEVMDSEPTPGAGGVAGQ